MSIRLSEYPTKCHRCGGPLTVSSCSRFNSDICCTACLDDEKGCPNWHAAFEAELAACQRGNYNYNHGLADEDRAYLAAKLEERRRVGA